MDFSIYVGKITYTNPEKGFGFIKEMDGSSIHFYFTNINGEKNIGRQVQYCKGTTPKGVTAFGTTVPQKIGAGLYAPEINGWYSVEEAENESCQIISAENGENLFYIIKPKGFNKSNLHKGENIVYNKNLNNKKEGDIVSFNNKNYYVKGSYNEPKYINISSTVEEIEKQNKKAAEEKAAWAKMMEAQLKAEEAEEAASYLQKTNELLLRVQNAQKEQIFISLNGCDGCVVENSIIISLNDFKNGNYKFPYYYQYAQPEGVKTFEEENLPQNSIILAIFDDSENYNDDYDIVKIVKKIVPDWDFNVKF